MFMTIIFGAIWVLQIRILSNWRIIQSLHLLRKATYVHFINISVFVYTCTCACKYASKLVENFNALHDDDVTPCFLRPRNCNSLSGGFRKKIFSRLRLVLWPWPLDWPMAFDS